MIFRKMVLLAAFAMLVTAATAEAQLPVIEPVQCEIVDDLDPLSGGKGTPFLLRCIDNFSVCYAPIILQKQSIKLAGDFECDPRAARFPPSGCIIGQGLPENDRDKDCIPDNEDNCPALANPSQAVRPGSLTWTWESTSPGMITKSPASSISQPSTRSS